jgi:hypothetical protein
MFLRKVSVHVQDYAVIQFRRQPESSSLFCLQFVSLMRMLCYVDERGMYERGMNFSMGSYL